MSAGRNIGWLLAAFLPRDRRDDLLADLDEEYESLAARLGERQASRWYANQIAKSVPLVARRRLRLLVSRPPSKLGANFVAEPPDTTYRWLGKAFFLFTVGWLGCAIWFVAPKLPSSNPRMLPVVILPDGPTYEVGLRLPQPAGLGGGVGQAGWVGPVEIETQCRCWNVVGWPDEDHAFMIALAPPVTIAFGLLIWVAVAGRLRRNRLPGLIAFSIARARS
jgi:hypothetical protein